MTNLKEMVVVRDITIRGSDVFSLPQRQIKFMPRIEQAMLKRRRGPLTSRKFLMSKGIGIGTRLMF